MSATELVLVPRLGMAVQEVTLVEWLVAEGSFVNEGQPVCVVETEKIDNEIVAPATGTIRFTAEPSGVYPVGGTLGAIDLA